MAVVTTTMTKRQASDSPMGVGISNQRTIFSTTETVGSENITSTFLVGRIPTTARIGGRAQLYCDDIGAATAAVKVGLFAVDGNITSNDAALNSSISIASANTGTALVSDVANYGKKAWEYISGLTADPGGYFDVKLTLITAAIDAVGTLTVELPYSID